jgi:hypothetical protein
MFFDALLSANITKNPQIYVPLADISVSAIFSKIMGMMMRAHLHSS